MTLNKYVYALRGFAKIFNTAAQKEKYQFIYPVRNAGISFRKAKELGFNVTSYMWKMCLNRHKRNKGIILVDS